MRPHALHVVRLYRHCLFVPEKRLRPKTQRRGLASHSPPYRLNLATEGRSAAKYQAIARRTITLSTCRGFYSFCCFCHGF